MKQLQGTKLVILNAGATYVRMFLCAGLTLFSSRWILAALGEVDFGLYAVVGGIMSFLSFLTQAMAGSAQRHFAYSIGQGNIREVRKWFSASILIHIILALVLVCIGLPFGQYMITHVLKIPVERLDVCHKVFIVSMLTVVIRVIVVPYMGMFTAKQRIFEISFFQVLQSVCMFGFAYSLFWWSKDRMLFYAVGMALISLGIAALQVFRSSLIFEECRFSFNITRTYIKELISFGGWSMFGAMGSVGSNQLLAFIINVYSGPRINASFRIANQVSGQINGVAQGLYNALAPEITSSKGRGDNERALSLSILANKFSFFIMCFVLVPVFADLEFILSVWLKNVPPFTESICRCVLATQALLLLTIGYTIIVRANGKIAGYQASLGGVALCTPLLSLILFKLGYSVVICVGVAIIMKQVINTGLRLCWVKHLFGVPLYKWVKDVVFPCMISLVPSVLGCVIINVLYQPSLPRTCALLCVCPLLLLGGVYLVGLKDNEKNYIMLLIRSGLRKLGYSVT